MIISLSHKIFLSSPFFLNCDNWVEKPLEILLIGGGVGTLAFFFRTIYGHFVNITIAEKNEQLKELGKTHFGLDLNREVDYIPSNITPNEKIKNTNNVKWDVNVNNYKGYINSLYDKRNNTKKATFYDLIIVQEANFFEDQNVSPNPEIINKVGLTQLKVSFI